MSEALRFLLQRVLSLLVATLALNQTFAQQTTAFTYQGQLRDGGTNASGTYTMIFRLCDQASGGSQIGSPITITPTLANGLFTVNLDFGAGAFNGKARWLDISISNSLTALFETLAPRVQVLPAPYALYADVASTVTNGAIMNAQLAANAVATANIQNNAVTNANLTVNAVATTNLQDGAVTAEKLAVSGVTTVKIQDSAVTDAKIASGQVVKSLNGLTDVVTLVAGANVGLFVNANALHVSAGPPNIQAFLTNGTFVVPANVTRIMVEMWGGGGGGGAGGVWTETIGATTYYYYNPGGGGGAGGYAVGVLNVAPGASYEVTVGWGGGRQPFVSWSGGTSSFGGLISVGGGTAGYDGIRYPGQGGNGGSSSGGLFPGSGGNGQNGISSTQDGGTGGNGGAVMRGGIGGWGGKPGGPGSDGKSPGGGGGGGGSNNSTQGTGGTGGQGLVLVHY